MVAMPQRHLNGLAAANWPLYHGLACAAGAALTMTEELDDIGGLSGHSIGLISVLVVGGIAAAISYLFFEWRPSHHEVVGLVLGLFCFRALGLRFGTC